MSQLGQSQYVQVSSDMAALLVEEMKREEVAITGAGGLRGKIWPPKEPFHPSNHRLGTITGEEEPLKHLQIFPWNEKDIGTKFYLYTRHNRNQSIIVGNETGDQYSVRDVPKNCSRMIFIVHGFRGAYTDLVFQKLKDALLDFPIYQDPCIIMTDWSKGAAFDPSSAIACELT